MSRWAVQAVPLDTERGRVDVAGWRHHDLFIDFRATTGRAASVLPFCWFVSHVQTGLGILGLLTDQVEARCLVERLHPLQDWSALWDMTHPTPAAVRDWIALLPCEWVVGRDTAGPMSIAHDPARVLN